MSTSSPPHMAQEQPPSEPSYEPAARRWPIRRIAWIVGMLLLLLVTYKMIRVGLYGLTAFNGAAEIRELVRAESTTQKLPELQAPLGEVTRSVQGIEKEMRLFSPFLNAMGWIPGLGATLGAMPELLTAGSEMMAVLNDGVSKVDLDASSDPDARMVPLLAAALASDEATAAQTAQRVARAQQAIARIPAADLHPALAERVSDLQKTMPLVGAGVAMLPSLGALLGEDEPATYLLLVQNNHELRATGGFLTSFGTVTISDGDISAIDFVDSYDVSRSDIDHPWAPEPMQRYMGIELMFLRDSNWSPDFPKTAQIAQTIFTQETGVEVDGVISIDLHAVELLVDALGPLEVAGADEPITGENIVDQIRQFWSQPLEGDQNLDSDTAEWFEQRKSFIPTLAQAALTRIRLGQFDYLGVGAAAQNALQEHAIQIWVDDPTLAAALEKTGWDGGLLPPPDSDYLALVDSNMGYNKVDAVIERSINYDVTWPDGEDQPALAVATINYHHPLSVPDHQCDWRPRYLSPEYDEMMQRCYFDYVRLYVPGGSELVSIEGVESDSISSERGERGTQVLAGYFQLLPGYQHNVVFTYRLPPRITPDDYALAIRRQSGTKPLTVQANVAEHQLATEVTDGIFVWEPNQ